VDASGARSLWKIENRNSKFAKLVELYWAMLVRSKRAPNIAKRASMGFQFRFSSFEFRFSGVPGL